LSHGVIATILAKQLLGFSNFDGRKQLLPNKKAANLFHCSNIIKVSRWAEENINV